MIEFDEGVHFASDGTEPTLTRDELSALGISVQPIGAIPLESSDIKLTINV